jgi:hypothetical protein
MEMLADPQEPVDSDDCDVGADGDDEGVGRIDASSEYVGDNEALEPTLLHATMTKITAHNPEMSGVRP